MTDQRMLIVTGYSGAGLSSALKHLEDNGYEVFDNFPIFLIESLISSTDTDRNVAIGIDTRTRGFNPDTLLQTAHENHAEIVFLTCDDQALQKRFTETRRRHPLARDRGVTDGIEKERELLAALVKKADHVIDTTGLSVHDLKHIIEHRFAPESKKQLSVTIMSFGFRNGLPRQADLVMDVRFLQNPHWEEKLRPLTGQDSQVGDYIRQDASYDPFMTRFYDLLDMLIPRYQAEGKSYLTIAMGCTGGKHRSVFTAEAIASWLTERNIAAHVTHRDLNIK